MDVSEILQVSWIYIKALGPAVIVITVVAVTEDLLGLIKKALNLSEKDY